jgi:hypothetical protein
MVAVVVPTGQGPHQTTVEVRTEFLVGRFAGWRKCPYDELAPPGQPGEAVAAQVPEPPLDPVPEHRVADGPSDHEPRAGLRRSPVTGRLFGRPPRGIRRGIRGGIRGEEVDDERVAAHAPATPRDATQVVTAGEAVRRREHGRGGTLTKEGRSSRASSHCQALAALAAARGQDRASGAGAHAQPESVHLVTTAVVRLVRTLAHGFSPMRVKGGRPGGLAGCAVNRHRPPTRSASIPAGVAGDMDMRHPSTPGDRETVRAAAPAGQIPSAPDYGMWKTAGHATAVQPLPQAFRNLWIAPCRVPRTALCSRLVEFPRVRLSPSP